MADRKNPTAIQIGQRIKQARRMAGFDTAAQLLEKIPDWGPSRLGNYEAGISLPSPDDVKLIAEKTDSSPCWIIFHGSRDTMYWEDSDNRRHSAASAR